jgi:hypothetical protein
MYFVSRKFLALPVYCLLGSSFLAFFAVSASAIRKAGTWPIDRLFPLLSKESPCANTELVISTESPL